MDSSDTLYGAYQIDLDRMEHYEAVALVLTLLAFPEDGPSPALDQRFGEICAFILRSRAEADAVWAEELQRMRPMHALIEPERATAVGRLLEDRLDKRLQAGRMAIAFLDPKATLPPGVMRLSLNQMAEFVAPGKDVRNTTNRIFEPSRPVLHLCVALAWLNLLAARLGIKAGAADAIIKDSGTLKRFLEFAEGLEQAILDSPGLGVSRLHRVRWP